MTGTLDHIETWIFDLDNTLYPAASNLFAQVDQRMTAFIAAEFGVDAVEARRLQKAFYHAHGTTLSGLMAEHGMKPERFLDYVHDIDLSVLAPDMALRSALAGLPGRRLIYTNGSRTHAERVCARLGILGLFDAIHCIQAANFVPKPNMAAYEHVVRQHNIEARRAAMFEDMARNLEAPHALGMTTALVTDGKSWESGSQMRRVAHAHIHFMVADLAGFLAEAAPGMSNTARV